MNPFSVEGKSVLITGASRGIGQALAQAVEQINRWHGDADCCIATGDLVDTGAPEEYEMLAGIVENLSVPFLPMIGNHDNRANLLAAFPPPGVPMPGYYQYRHDLGDVTLLCLDTHLPGDDAGALDAARLGSRVIFFWPE